ncbi:hypothetical protein [Intrasporangium flavum]|uniref:hypothetical protein n=1 Tax=Intrasporangium flavum TaxID=1428657 RepID=UPI00096CF9B9|nr:hypothetical protein [Intrasporangium flavum]
MTSTPRPLTPDEVRALTLPTEPWLSCEDCFALADRYAEALVEDPGTGQLPEMLVHLHACSACNEEAESLVRLIASDVGVDPAPALARLRG